MNKSTMISLLYVDDEPALLDLCKVFLEKTGEFVVTTKISATEALGALELQIYDAIICDYQMPDTDGITFLQEVRSKYPEIPFILFTGRGREEVAIKAFELGADFYLQKGGDPKAQFAELTQKIRQAIRRRKAEEALRQSERYYRALFKYTESATIIIEEDMTISLANDAFAELLGSPREMIEGKMKWTRFIVPKDLDRMRGYHYQRRKSPTDVPAVYEFQFITNDGHVRDILAHVGMIPGTSQSVASLLDITSQKQTEDELRRRNDELQASYEQMAATDEQIRGQFEMLTASERMIKDSELKFRSIVESVPLGMHFYQLTEDGQLVFKGANPAAEKILGISHEMLLGKTIEEAFPDLAGTDIPEQYRNVACDSITWYTELVNFSEGGVSRAFAIWAFPTLPGSMVAAFLDITRNKEAEHSLQESVDWYRNVIEDQTEFITRFLPDGTHIFVNEAYCRYFGVRREEIIGTKFMPHIPGEDRGRIRALIASLTPGNPVGTIEQRTIMQDGSTRWQRWVDRAIFHEDGGLKEIQSVGWDITDMKKIETALQESEAKYRTIIENLQDLLYQTDLEGNITMISPSGARLAGYESPGDLIGHNIALELYADPDERVKFLAAIKEKGSVSDYPLVIRSRDGTIHHVTASSQFYYDKAGNILGIEGILHDVTERKNAEEALRLANRKLYLLSSITRHDINNQLTVLLGNLDILREMLSGPAAEVFYKNAIIAAGRISSMIRFTYDYEKIGVEAPVWQGISELVRRAAAEAPLGGVMVENSIPGNLEIFADPLIFRVFYNLMDNAARYGRSITTISFSAVQRGDDMVITCMDNGEGVITENKERIFEHGFGQTTGLGLSLSREILAITNCSILENGEPGKGARFEILVPKPMFRCLGTGE